MPFIANLVTLGAGSGLVIVMTKGAPIAGGPPKAMFLSNPWIGPFSKPVLLVAVVALLAGLFLHKARFGRYAFAVGSNAFAARAAGINVKRHLTKVYMLSGALAGLAGMFSPRSPGSPPTCRSAQTCSSVARRPRPACSASSAPWRRRQWTRRLTPTFSGFGIAVPSSNRSVGELSGGQRQAVAIGRAVAWAKKVIILDEPTNHAGARKAGEVLEVIKAARPQGLGVIFISHTLHHVLQVTDRIVVLRLGRVVRDAPTSEFDADSLLGTITGLIEA